MKLRFAHRVNWFTPFVVVGGGNFLPVRILFSLLIASCSLLVSCKGSQVVSSTDKKDSTATITTTNNITKNDSSTYRETEEKKTIAASTIDANLGAVSRLDSIVKALKTLPKGVPREIIYKDKDHSAEFALLLDSLGNIHARCTSLEKTYYEKSVERERYISSLVNQLTQKNIELRETKTEVLQLRKSWWQRAMDLLEYTVVKIFLILILICIAVIFLEFSVRKGKDFFNFFKPRI